MKTTRNLAIFFLFTLMSSSLLAQTVIEVDSKDALPYFENYDAESQVIIDGRTQSMFKSGHLENAININAFSEEADEKLGSYLDRERLLVYCTNSTRTETIIDKLKSMGYAGDIVAVTDGISGWKSKGFPVVTRADSEANKKVLASSADKPSERLPGLKPIVQVFGTAGYDVDNQRYSYGFGRAHLGFQYQFNDRWSGKIIIDRGRATTVGDITVTDADGNPLEVTNTASEGSYYTMWLKFASLNWQVNDHFLLEGGALLQNHYITQERFWGMRYVAQTFQDMYWHIPSTDLGFMARYKINDVLGVDAALTNGEGPRRKQDSEGAVKSAIGIDIVPSKNIQARIYYHNLQAKATEKENEQMFSAFAGFRPTKKLRVGAEYNYMSNFSQIDNLNSYGFSVYSVVSFNKATEIFGRFDYLAFDIPKNIDYISGNDSNTLIAGVSYMPFHNVSLSLNYQGRYYNDNTLGDNNSVKLSMEYKF
ncbi:MAG: outer membrane beta-barrel protein [Prolixibacteraceae bacterium]|nr:outer membrane beta-barrel protein [Prolixibacteraceae bacterium]